MKYVDGFVVAIPVENKAVYRKMAAKAAPFLKESGEKGPEPQDSNEFGLTVDEPRRSRHEASRRKTRAGMLAISVVSTDSYSKAQS